MELARIRRVSESSRRKSIETLRRASIAFRRMATVAEYGGWKSVITPEVFGKGNCKAICELQANKHGVFWVEQHIETGKRGLFHRQFSIDATGSQKNVHWAVGYSVQNAVHEYGGGALSLLPDGTVLFTTIDGLFHQKTSSEEPVLVADGMNKTLRFADISSNGVVAYCVLEDHSGEGLVPDNKIARIDLNTKQVHDVASGCDFYACPRLSPGGKHLVWMQWNHNNMPWDETSIAIAPINEDGSIGEAKVILSGVGKKVNYYGPTWSPNGQLHVICDKTNFWNVYTVDVEKADEEGFAVIKNICPIDAEIGYPLWQFGDRPFATNGRNTVFNVNGELKLRSGDQILSIDTQEYTVFTHLSLTETDVLYCIARGPKSAGTLLKIELRNETFHTTPIRESRDLSELAHYPISKPEQITFDSDGVQVSGWFYPPKSCEYTGPQGARPPVILFGHSGPTAPAWNSLDMKKQFYTSRGFAIFDVNYRGSTGFGTEFRNKLYDNWGIVDRNDMINGAKALADRGLVDPKKICITGSSAGGFLLLASLLHSDVFSAAVSRYGVADLEALVKDTHKFELGYNQTLIGKYPEEIEKYKQLSPIMHIDKLNTPVAFIHGKEDTVVPYSQSVEMYEKLKERGVTTALMLFEEEGHGFRNGTSIRQSTEATYYFLCKVLGIQPSVHSELEIVNLPGAGASGDH